MQKSKIRLKLWTKDPHCYWCGIKTELEHDITKPSDITATIDHIRSRYSENRPKPEERDKKWTSGIIVLACYKCNNTRASVEQEFLMRIDPDYIRAKSGSSTDNEEIIRLQSRLASMMIKFIESGGTLHGTKDHKIISMAKRLSEAYQKRKEAKCNSHQ